MQRDQSPDQRRQSAGTGGASAGSREPSEKAFRAAASYARAGLETDPAQLRIRETPTLALIELADAEEARLREFAKRHGISRHFTPPPGSRVFEESGENHVWFAPEGRVFKVTKNDRYGYAAFAEPDAPRGVALNAFAHKSRLSPPSWYLERLDLFNREFPESAVSLEAMIDNRRGILEIVISQQLFQGSIPSWDQMGAYLLARGFSEHGDGAWYRPEDRLVVADVHPENFILATDGHVYPLDLVMRTADDELDAVFTREWS